MSGNHKDFPGGPVIRTLCSHCRGRRFNPLVPFGELRSSMLHITAKKQNKTTKKGNSTDNISYVHHGLKLVAATLDPQYVQPTGFTQEEMRISGGEVTHI